MMYVTSVFDSICRRAYILGVSCCNVTTERFLMIFTFMANLSVSPLSEALYIVFISLFLYFSFCLFVCLFVCLFLSFVSFSFFLSFFLSLIIHSTHFINDYINIINISKKRPPQKKNQPTLKPPPKKTHKKTKNKPKQTNKQQTNRQTKTQQNKKTKQKKHKKPTQNKQTT